MYRNKELFLKNIGISIIFIILYFVASMIAFNSQNFFLCYFTSIIVIPAFLFIILGVCGEIVYGALFSLIIVFVLALIYVIATGGSSSGGFIAVPTTPVLLVPLFLIPHTAITFIIYKISNSFKKRTLRVIFTIVSIIAISICGLINFHSDIQEKNFIYSATYRIDFSDTDFSPKSKYVIIKDGWAFISFHDRKLLYKTNLVTNEIINLDVGDGIESMFSIGEKDILYTKQRCLYKVAVDGKSHPVLLERHFSSGAVQGEWFYYGVAENGSTKIYKININNVTEKIFVRAINENSFKILAINNSYIVYSDLNKLSRVSTDGSELIVLFNYKDNSYNIRSFDSVMLEKEYCYALNEYTNLYRIRLDGQEARKIFVSNKGTIQNFKVYDDFIYVMTEGYSNNSAIFCVVENSGSSFELLKSNSKILYFFINDKKLYYIENYVLGKITRNKYLVVDLVTKEFNLIKDDIWVKAIANHEVYFSDSDLNTVKMSIDGAQEQILRKR